MRIFWVYNDGKQNGPGAPRVVVYSNSVKEENAMDTGIIISLSLQGVTLSVMVALFWGLMKVLRQDIREVKTDLGSDLRDLDGHVRKLQVDMVLVKKDVTLLKNDMAVVKYDVAVLKNDMTEVKHKVVVLEKNMTAVHEHLGIEGAEIPPPPQGPVPPPVLVVE